MPRWEDHELRIEVDHVALPEFGETSSIESDGTPCVTVWIPSESGKVHALVSMAYFTYANIFQAFCVSF
jgi:hypothetical protein